MHLYDPDLLEPTEVSSPLDRSLTNLINSTTIDICQKGGFHSFEKFFSTSVLYVGTALSMSRSSSKLSGCPAFSKFLPFGLYTGETH
ncbi:hypothetical protein Dimus_038473 [Dionaea muscipula]